MLRLPAVRQGERKDKMCRVQCIACGEIGYTASPDYTRCGCSGKFMVIPGTANAIKFGWLKRHLNFLIYSILLKQILI